MNAEVSECYTEVDGDRMTTFVVVDYIDSYGDKRCVEASIGCNVEDLQKRPVGMLTRMTETLLTSVLKKIEE